MAQWAAEGFKVLIPDKTIKFGIGYNTVVFHKFVSGMPTENSVQQGVVFGEINERVGTLTGGSAGEICHIF